MAQGYLRCSARAGVLGWIAAVVVSQACVADVPPAGSSTTTPAAKPLAPAAPAKTDPDVTGRVGLKFCDPAIATALDLFDAGKFDESIDGLYKLVNDSGQQDEVRKQELQLAAAMLEIRAGDRRKPDSRSPYFSIGIGNAKNYAKSWSDSEIGARASVIALTAAKAINDGTRKYERLGPQPKWIESLRMVANDLERSIRNEDKRLVRSISRAALPNAEDALRKMAKYVEQRHVIELDRDTMKKEVVAHGRELDEATQRLNDLLSDMIDEAEALKQAWKRASRRTAWTARDKANEAIKAAEQCRAVVQRAREHQGRLCRLFPDACDFKPVQPREVPDRVR